MIYGDVGRNEAVRTAIAGGVVYLRRFTVDGQGVLVARVAALIDGMGGTVGQQRLRAAIYDSLGRQVARSPAVVVTSGQAAGIVEMLVPAGTALPPGDYWAGVLGGAAGGVARFAAAPADPSLVDAWSGPGAIDSRDPLEPVETPGAVVPSVYVHVVPVWVPRPQPDRSLVQLPWSLAQAALSATGPLSDSSVRARVGWHGVSVDDSGEATAIVRSGGPLADLVGERIRITRRIGPVRRSVTVLVVDEQPWPDDVDLEDVSVARRSWLQLGDWATPFLRCTVEVLK